VPEQKLLAHRSLCVESCDERKRERATGCRDSWQMPTLARVDDDVPIVLVRKCFDIRKEAYVSFRERKGDGKS
jgi:hypothetical protein